MMSLALFISVPIEPAITIIKRKLELDQELHKRTMKSRPDHQPTGVLFENHLFPVSMNSCKEQLLGLSSAPLWPTLYMEDFEIKAIISAKYSPRIWKRSG